MLTAYEAANISENRVTTLTASIGIRSIHGDELIAPCFHRRPRGDALESEQPSPVVAAPAGHHQGSRHHPPRLVHHVQLRFGDEHRAGILHQGNDLHFPVLPVRLFQPRDYAGRLPSTPARFSRDRTVSVGSAPLAT